jgi:hypothetical protein
MSKSFHQALAVMCVQIAHIVFDCRIHSPREMTALSILAANDGMYFSHAVYSRVKSGGSLFGCNNDLIAALNAAPIVAQDVQDQTNRLNHQIDEAIDQVRTEMGARLESAIVQLYLRNQDENWFGIL